MTPREMVIIEKLVRSASYVVTHDDAAQLRLRIEESIRRRSRK